MKKLIILIFFIATAILFAACAVNRATPSEVSPAPSPTPTPEESPAIVRVVQPAEPITTSVPEATLVAWDGIVEHLFFHPIITYPEMAFDGDYDEAGLDEYMITINEYKLILEKLYENNYILVNINEVWSEVTDADGNAKMQRNTLYIPEGKKPLIVSIDDLNYYKYMLENGFTHRLIIGRDGEIWSCGKDPEGNTVVSQELDTVTILDKFVEAHPDFSLNGAKAMLCLTGYEGILGYRTNTASGEDSEEFEANRQREIERVKPVVQKLKDTGWYFSSHTWGHINLSNSSLSKVKTDSEKWANEVGSLIGETSVLVYPYGARPDGSDVNKTGDAFKYYHSLGFRIFASVGTESYSKIKTDISAVICDRMHSDGASLRRERDRYMKFYDAAEVWDDARPDDPAKYPRKW